ASWSAELPAFLEEDANLRRGPVVVVGQDFDNDRHLVRRVTFENDMLHDELVVADARPFFDGALDDVARNAGPARLIHDGRQAGVSRRLRAAEFRRHHDFLHQLSDDLAFLQSGNFPFSVQPLATHTLALTVALGVGKRWSRGALAPRRFEPARRQSAAAPAPNPETGTARPFRPRQSRRAQCRSRRSTGTPSRRS